MGRSSRTPEAEENYKTLASKGYKIAGQIKAPGTLEEGDFIWIDDSHAAVGLGPRTNAEGIRQLKEILGTSVNFTRCRSSRSNSSRGCPPFNVNNFTPR